MNNDKTTIPATAIKVRWIHVLKLWHLFFYDDW
jgi:hypothetical protein